MKDLRQNYTQHVLLKEDMPDNPFSMFERWFNYALENGVMEPNAMTLSTALNNEVDSRTVLLKDLRDKEFVFFTNYNSTKGKHLAANPNCSLCFLWLANQRQIVVRGTATKIQAEESEEYFQSRPVESRIGAWASDQSQAVASREVLDNKMDALTEKYNSGEVPRPEHWGGYAVEPIEVEFWQGRAGRLHDRMVYRRTPKGWELERLQP